VSGGRRKKKRIDERKKRRVLLKQEPLNTGQRKAHKKQLTLLDNQKRIWGGETEKRISQPEKGKNPSQNYSIKADKQKQEKLRYKEGEKNKGKGKKNVYGREKV